MISNSHCVLVISGGVENSVAIILETNRLKLIDHNPKHILALLESSDEYEKVSGTRVADGVHDFLLSASADFFAQLERAAAPDPWKFGFAVIHKIDNVMIGMCGFPGPPGSDAAAEIAYGIAPSYQGKGYATEVATALVDFASRDSRVRIIRAHTLAQTNASTRVLEKCGFKKVGEMVDPENNLVWRWEKNRRVEK